MVGSAFVLFNNIYDHTFYITIHHTIIPVNCTYVPTYEPNIAVSQYYPNFYFILYVSTQELYDWGASLLDIRYSAKKLVGKDEFC